MTNVEDSIFGYDPSNHRSDLPDVFSGFVVLVAVFAGLLLI